VGKSQVIFGEFPHEFCPALPLVHEMTPVNHPRQSPQRRPRRRQKHKQQRQKNFPHSNPGGLFRKAGRPLFKHANFQVDGERFSCFVAARRQTAANLSIFSDGGALPRRRYTKSRVSHRCRVEDVAHTSSSDGCVRPKKLARP
jgi:hypothetical protein